VAAVPVPGVPEGFVPGVVAGDPGEVGCVVLGGVVLGDEGVPVPVVLPPDGVVDRPVLASGVVGVVW